MLMLTVKHDLRSDPLCKDGVTIRHIADTHLGSPQCDEDYVRALVDENIKNHWYTFLCGDLLDVGLKDSKSDVYTQTGTVGYWLDKAVDIFRPLAENGLILGVVSGNHEQRLMRSAGFDITHEICERLEIGHLYSPYVVLAMVSVGTQNSRRSRNGQQTPYGYSYVIRLAHGHGGGSTAGGRALALDKAALSIDADLYLQGHTHHSSIQTNSIYRFNRPTLSLKQVDRVMVCCGSCLDSDSSYAEGMNLSPSDKRYPRVLLHADKQYISYTG